MAIDDGTWGACWAESVSARSLIDSLMTSPGASRVLVLRGDAGTGESTFSPDSPQARRHLRVTHKRESCSGEIPAATQKLA